ATQLALAAGRSLADLGLRQEEIAAPHGFAMQVRVNMETLAADGTLRPSTGALRAFEVPTGPGIRVDTHGYAGYRPSPSFDSLLAKVVARGSEFPAVVGKAYRALSEFRVDGVATNLPFLQNLLRHPALGAYRVTTQFVDEHLAELLAAGDAGHRPPAAGLAGAKVDPRDPLAVLVHGKTAGAAPPRAAARRRAARRGRAPPHDRAADGAREHRRPLRPGIVRRVRAAGDRGAATAASGRGADRADARRRAGRGHRPGERAALRRVA